MKNLWIINNGILLYEHNEESFDSALIGSFLSVIDIYICKTFEDEVLTKIKLKNRNIYFARQGTMLFIISTDKKTKEKYAKEKLNTIVKKFNEIYDGNLVAQYMGNQTYFKNFKSNLSIVHAI